MADVVYNRMPYLLATGALNWTTATIKCLLVNSSYTPNKDHNFVSDVSANELSGTGYTGGFAGSGRKTLTGATVTEDDTNDVVVLDCDDLTWLLIDAGTIAGLVFYKNGTSDADSPLLFYSDVTNVTTIGGTVTYAVPSGGLLELEQP